MSMADTADKEKQIATRVTPQSAGQIVLSQSAGGLAFSNMADAIEFAKCMAIAGIAIPKHLRANVGACLAVTIQAVEWRISPFALANKSYFVNDRIAYESQLVQAVILQRAPIKGRLKFDFSGDGDRRKCHVIATLRDGGEVDYTSPEIGKIPVKNSPLWKGDPDQQLAYYSGRALCRRHFPDVLLGIYTPDELYGEISPGAQRQDIAPPLSLAAKIDRLASPPHNPETGEISPASIPDSDAALVSVAPEDSGTAVPPATVPEPRPPIHPVEGDWPGDGEPQELAAVTFARQRGVRDRAQGVQRRAVPTEYRESGREDEAEAWRQGWGAVLENSTNNINHRTTAHGTST